jgi:uncharacterized protein YbbC (DUF1343 family)
MGKILLALMVSLLIAMTSVTASIAYEKEDSLPGLKEEQLVSIEGIVNEAISARKMPGAVILIGNQGTVVYRRAFGHRAIVPERLPMTEDTIFDLGSLTKVIATTTALMQLVEKGKLRIEDPVTKYWPEFKANGKENITVRQLLTHYSGLRPSLDLKPKWSGYKTALEKAVREKPISPPGTCFLYSDINFIILGELVSRISGLPLDLYCTEHVFGPLGMKDSCFRPSPSQDHRIAPTQYEQGARGKTLWGEVHDPTARSMGGVAGHAGLFSTVDDLSIFAQMLLNGGSHGGVSILSPLMIEKMTSPQTPPNKMALRGLGWDIDSPYASNRGELFPVGSYGHTGYTGTSIWIDPVSTTYVIVLTNRVHPNGKGEAGPLHSQIATVVASSLEPLSAERVLSDRRSLTGNYELMRGYGVRGLRNGQVQTGIDVWNRERFASLRELCVGLITNHSGLDSRGQPTMDLLLKTPGVKLACIFVPEHGLHGMEDEKVLSTTRKGLPIYSLYGDAERPTEQMLNGLDAIVFDVQDAGVRFYTYVTTMGYAMEAAAKKGIPFYILDRPNPITGSFVQGPVMERDLKSFTGYFPLPVRHGMTVGELAEMFNTEYRIGAKVRVIKMRGYRRSDWYDETGLRWVNPSPNLRTLTQAILYPGVGMVEGANVSVGRGTDTPFELLGSPWIDARQLAAFLNKRRIQGVRFMPVDFEPKSSRFKNQLCHGVQIILLDREALDSPGLGVEIASALHRLYPGDFQLEKTLPLIGSREVLQSIKEGHDPDFIVLSWQESLEEFRRLRAKYLLY